MRFAFPPYGPKVLKMGGCTALYPEGGMRFAFPPYAFPPYNSPAGSRCHHQYLMMKLKVWNGGLLRPLLPDPEVSVSVGTLGDMSP